MNDHTWHKGKPPHIGWWNASICRDRDAWRWWSGKHWSIVVYPHNDIQTAISRASMLAISDEDYIEWTDYWPENARVERIKP